MLNDDTGCPSGSRLPGRTRRPGWMASPAPWAVTALAITSLMLRRHQAALPSSAQMLIVLPVAFFSGDPVRVIVAVTGFPAATCPAGRCPGPTGRSG